MIIDEEPLEPSEDDDNLSHLDNWVEGWLKQPPQKKPYDESQEDSERYEDSDFY